MSFRIAVALFLLALTTACGSASSPAMPTTPSGGNTVAIVSGASTLTSTAFAPNPITVAVGGTVTWMNNDSITHTSVANNGAWSSGAIAPGGSFSAPFMTAGTFAYHCSIHPGMIGTVTVQ
jgi:plastocyanin